MEKPRKDLIKSTFPIVLFDGYCPLCIRSVRFIIRHNKANTIKFASLDSTTGNTIIENLNPKLKQIDSIIFINHGKIFFQSGAALRICYHLNGPWKVFYLFLIVPPFVRNLVYRFAADRRNKWFGRNDKCMIPTQDIANRFID